MARLFGIQKTPQFVSQRTISLTSSSYVCVCVCYVQTHTCVFTVMRIYSTRTYTIENGDGKCKGCCPGPSSRDLKSLFSFSPIPSPAFSLAIPLRENVIPAQIDETYSETGWRKIGVSEDLEAISDMQQSGVRARSLRFGTSETRVRVIRTIVYTGFTHTCTIVRSCFHTAGNRARVDMNNPRGWKLKTIYAAKIKQRREKGLYGILIPKDSGICWEAWQFW